MKKTDVAIAGVTICVGLAAFIKAWDYPAQSRMIPLIYSSALMTVSFLFALRTVLSRKTPETADGHMQKEPLPKVFLVMGVILGYIASIQVLGFYSSTALFLLLFMGILRAAPLFVAAIISLATPAIVYFFFEKMLHIPVPGGIFF
jgi:hypothetical protein